MHPLVVREWLAEGPRPIARVVSRRALRPSASDLLRRLRGVFRSAGARRRSGARAGARPSLRAEARTLDEPARLPESGRRSDLRRSRGFGRRSVDHRRIPRSCVGRRSGVLAGRRRLAHARAVRGNPLRGFRGGDRRRASFDGALHHGGDRRPLQHARLPKEHRRGRPLHGRGDRERGRVRVRAQHLRRSRPVRGDRARDRSRARSRSQHAVLGSDELRELRSQGVS